MSINGGAPVPATQERDEPAHVCGKCRNPFTVGNPACPNARPK